MREQGTSRAQLSAVETTKHYCINRRSTGSQTYSWIKYYEVQSPPKKIQSAKLEVDLDGALGIVTQNSGGLEAHIVDPTRSLPPEIGDAIRERYTSKQITDVSKIIKGNPGKLWRYALAEKAK